ncbi:hypothetical protein D918_05995 [Trichuris suis]|nr:hypothetical protein D918_05995 [Trichuris suis]
MPTEMPSSLPSDKDSSVPPSMNSEAVAQALLFPAIFHLNANMIKAIGHLQNESQFEAALE